MPYALEALHLSKLFRAGAPRESWLVSALGQRARACFGQKPAPLAHELARPRYALEDVSFAIEPGAAVALIGENGAGKSTLLRILSRIIEPSSGRARVRGRLQALFEAGAGFERDLSGRDNVFLKAAIHNLPDAETARRFDRMVAFAGVEDAIDLPVKRYSTGMQNRLGIAVGLHLDCDLLVLDEAFNAIDDAFRERAFALIRGQMQQRGLTVLLVSHELAHLRALCARGLVLRSGKLVLDDTLERALSLLRASDAAQPGPAASDGLVAADVVGRLEPARADVR